MQIKKKRHCSKIILPPFLIVFLSKGSTLQLKSLTTFLLVCCLAMFNTTAKAEVTITEITPIQFPDAVLNPSKTARLRVTWKGQLRNVRNTQVLGDVYNEAEFLVTSDTNNLITVDMTSVGDVPGVILKTFQFRYKNETYTKFPVTGLANPGVDGEIVQVGMRIQYTKNTSTGGITPSYDITITEEEPIVVP